MDNETLELFIKLLAAISPFVSIGVGIWNNRTSKRQEARLRIILMMMDDQMRYEHNGKFPTNYSAIHAAYDAYHKNGGNGEITQRLLDYETWYSMAERERLEKLISNHDEDTISTRKS